MTVAHLKENLSNFLQDDNATAFCMTLFDISQGFDDIYDEGQLSKKDTLKLISKTLIELPNNPFFCAYKHKLQPLLESYFLQWKSANAIESSRGDLHKAYMLRAFIYQIFHYCAYILGRDVPEELFQDLYGETFKEYSMEFLDV